jgi:hypothetical protein
VVSHETDPLRDSISVAKPAEHPSLPFAARLRGHFVAKQSRGLRDGTNRGKRPRWAYRQQRGSRNAGLIGMRLGNRLAANDENRVGPPRRGDSIAYQE